MTISDSLISLDALPSVLTACFVLLLGTVLSQRIALLARYSIPSPIVGGVVFAIVAAMLTHTTGPSIAMANTAKSDLLLLFFACLGLTSDLRLLLRGGSRLMRFVVALAPFLLAQDALGVLMAKLLGLHPFLGLVAGSITLAGGRARHRRRLCREIRRGERHSRRHGVDHDLGDAWPCARRRWWRSGPP
jgi:ESS family glutamate:Na+ symporter